MKKAIKKITVFLCAILGAALFVLAGCSEEQTFVEKTYDSGDSAIESVEIDVTDRELQIEQSKDGEVHIYYHDSQKEYLEIGVSDDRLLSVKLTMDKDWTDFIGVKPSAEYRKIRICIPQGVVLSLSATTTNEAIKATGLSVAGSLSLNSNGGSVICERIDAGNSIALTAKNGDITGSILGGWDDYTISCVIKKGDSNLPENKEGGEKKLFADCNNGNINIEFVS